MRRSLLFRKSVANGNKFATLEKIDPRNVLKEVISRWWILATIASNLGNFRRLTLPNDRSTHLVRYTMFRPAFWTFHLSSHVVNEAIHAGFHAKAVLAWQKLRVPVAVQAYSARQQLLELLHACKTQKEHSLRRCASLVLRSLPIEVSIRICTASKRYFPH